MRQHKAPIGLAIFLLIQGPAFALARWLLNLFPLPTRLGARWQWGLRKGFWNNFARLKFRGSRKLNFPIPIGSPRKIVPVDFSTKFPSIPIQNIQVADHIPWDELRGKNFFKDFPHKILMILFTKFQLGMYRILSPMQPGLDEIDADHYEALRQAYQKRHGALFEPPVMPLEFQGSLDLGALAVKGPYACYLEKYTWEQTPQLDTDWTLAQVVPPPKWNDKFGRWEDHLYKWDFWSLKDYEHHPGLYNLGCLVLFLVDPPTGTVQPIAIKGDLGNLKPGRGVSKRADATWEFAKKLALCAATNHLSLVYHFNGIHLASAEHLAIATRNHLYPDHVLCRLLWPYIYHTQLSNQIVIPPQMVEGGDFDSIFSFTHKGMCDLFSSTYKDYQFTVNDPEMDAGRRGIPKDLFDTPTQDDLQELFELFHRHVEKYLDIYYNGSNAVLQRDEPVLNWLDSLNHPLHGIPTFLPDPHPVPLPNSLPVHRGNVTLARLSRLLASFLYLVTVRHVLAGSFLWNYQLWAHKQPPRLYRNGRRLPLDVYRRLVNANFNLNVPRTPLMWKETEDDWSYLASDQCGQQSQAKRVWSEFQEELKTLEKEWRTKYPWYVWRVYPSMLEVNIND
jgi:hypothetical protein